MNVRIVSASFAALAVILGSPSEAKSLFGYVLPHQAQVESNEHRAGTLNQEDALALYSPGQRKASFDACADQFPGKQPFDVRKIPVTMKPIALCSDNFAVLYSQASKTPLVVVEKLTAEQLIDAKGEKRTNQFYPDPRIPKWGRAELSDFRGELIDRGHQAPAADAPTPHAMAQSFSLSNMVPQNQESNRKSWRSVESATRKFAQRAAGNVFVFTGPIFDEGHGFMGANDVWVPTRLFKLVYDEATGRAWAFILPNAAAKVEAPVDYATFVRETGLHVLDGVKVTGSAGKI